LPSNEKTVKVLRSPFTVLQASFLKLNERRKSSSILQSSLFKSMAAILQRLGSRQLDVKESTKVQGFGNETTKQIEALRDPKELASRFGKSCL
jgi:hypothetical protein